MAIWDDAWGGIKSVGKSIGGYVTGKEAAQTVQAPEMDESKFVQGGGRTRHGSEAMADKYTAQASALGWQAQGAQDRAGPQQASSATAYGEQGMEQWQSSRGSILSAANQQAPSQAEAQLRAGQDAAMRQQLALARSGRGAGGSAAAMRQAAWNNADINAQTNQAAAQLRAQEQQAQLARQMQALQYVGGTDAAMGQYGLSAGMQGEMAQRGLNDQRSATLMQGQLASQGMVNDQLAREMAGMSQYELARTGNLLSADAQSAQLVSGRGNAMIGGVTSMIGGVAGMLSSDERGKKDRERLEADNAALRRTLAALGGEEALDTVRSAPGYTYRYRSPREPGAGEGLHAGPMAQDLERTPLGRSLVTEDAHGRKVVDGGRAGLTALAATSAQQRELDRLEAQVAALMERRAR